MGIEIALIASAVIGGISANRAAKSAEKAGNQSTALSREGLALQERQLAMEEDRYETVKDEYEKWLKIYGPLQEDLGTYYTNLTGNSLSNPEVVRIQEASQKARDQVTVSMAQSGRMDNAAREHILGTMEYQAEIDKANVRSTAEDRAMLAKTQFLAVGLGQANSLSSQQSNISQSMQQNANAQGNLLTNMGNTAVKTAAVQGAIWSDYTNQLQGLLGYGYRQNAFGSTSSVGGTEK